MTLIHRLALEDTVRRERKEGDETMAMKMAVQFDDRWGWNHIIYILIVKLS